MQRKRIHAATGTAAVNVATTLVATVDETNAVNIHGMIADFSIEPENADANANGTWALTCLPRVTTAVPAIGISALETEGDNPVIIACGVWAASNQTPFNKTLVIKTSRNCQAGTRLVLSIRNEGVSAGIVRHIRTLCYFTSSL